MDGMLQAPAPTALDAVAATISLLVYLAIGAAALAAAPRDARARTFMTIAVASAGPYALAPLQWWKGSAAYTPAILAVTTTAFTVGSVALFHFSQVFPYRRPWIRERFRWLLAAYLVLPPPVTLITWLVGSLLVPMDTAGSGGVGAVSMGVSELTILLLIVPLLLLLFVVGLVLPFSGVMSLVKSWQEAKKARDAPARTTTFWMLMSQLAGGVLTVLVLPLLHYAGITGAGAMLIAGLAYAFGLLMPLAFAAAVWRYRMLSTSA
jgi:hypothetical protein